MGYRFGNSTRLHWLVSKVRLTRQSAAEANPVPLGIAVAIAIAVSIFLLLLASPPSGLHAQSNSDPTITSHSRPNSVTTGVSASFSATATDPDGNITQWRWFLDDVQQREYTFLPQSSATRVIIHTFATAGTYTIKSEFLDEGGLSDSVSWSVEVNYPATTVSVTVAASPTGRTVTVDGTDQTAPYSATWDSGSSHTLNVPSPQDISGVSSRYVFSSWSQGGSQSQSVSPTSDATYTANFTRQHFLSTRTEPNGIGIPGGGTWYDHGSTSTVGPAPSIDGYEFSYWRKGGAGGSNIGTDPVSVSVTVDAPLLVEAVYTASDIVEPVTVQFRSAYRIVREGTGEVDLTVSISASPAEDVKVRLGFDSPDNTATYGVDFQPTATEVTFKADTTTLTQEVPVTILDSIDVELPETFFVELQKHADTPSFVTISDSRSSVQVEIFDDDAGTVGFGEDEIVVNEGDSVEFRVEVLAPVSSCPIQFPFDVQISYADPDGALSSGSTIPSSLGFNACQVAGATQFQTSDDSGGTEVVVTLDKVTQHPDGTEVRAVKREPSSLTIRILDSISPGPSNRAPSVSRVSPSASSLTLAAGDSQTFSASAIDPDNNLKRYEWTVNGVSKDDDSWLVLLPTGTVTKEFTHTFSGAGTYTVKATFTDKGGSSGYVTWTVEVLNRAPVISNATPPPSSTVSLTMGDSQTFEATVSDPDNNLKSWDWSVDGTSEDSGTWGTSLSSTPDGSVTRSFSHTFSSVGTHTVKATFTDAEGDSDSEEWTVQVTGQDQAIYRWSYLGVTVVEIAATCESNLASVGIGEDVTFTSRVVGMVTPLNSSINIYMKPVVKETLRGIDAPDSLKTESASIGARDEVTLTYEGGAVHPGEYEFGCRFYWERAGPLPDSELTKQGSSPSLNRVSVDRGWGIYSGSEDTEFENCGAVDKMPPFLVGENIALQAKGPRERRIPGYYFGLLLVSHDGALIDGMFGHKRGAAINSSAEPLVSGTHTFDSPGEYVVDCELHYQGGVWVPYNPLVDLEEKLKKLVEMLVIIFFKPETLIDTTIQVALREFVGVTSTRLTVVEARWGTAGLGIERGTEMLLEGRERIRVRVSREETKDRVGGRIPAPYFHIDGPELGQTKEATRCGEGDQDHGKYLSLCWETTFDIPVNDTINEMEYSVWVESHFIEDDQTNGFTVEVSPDAAGLRAFYDDTGGPNWVNKDGWLSNDPIGDWYGVDTNPEGRVVKLDLRRSGQRGNGLQGSLPSDLKDTLPFLHTLYLGGNSGLTECVREDLLAVQFNDLDSLDLPTCEDTCAWGVALPDPNNQGLLADCEALLAARDTLTAGQKSERLNWSAREPIGNWRGVVREGNPERVIKLEIEQPPRLWGYLSGELAKLSSLQVLTLANAGLQGEIPEELKDLASLHTLNLQGNQLAGGIPRELSGLTNLRILDLSDNDLNRPIPGNLTELVNLQTLRLDGNRFSGCIPEGLRGVASNDLGDLGLPFCDVLLSGLTISPGVLTPRFESGRTDYTAEVGVSRITVTPTNSHNATFMFLDEENAPIPDADDKLEGHQVELGDGVTTIGVKVLSQDARASHTYTIQVSRGGSLPDAPAIVVPITPGAASLTVSWTAPPGETGITSYDLRHIKSGSQPDANWTVVESVWTSGSGSLNYQITGLANGVQYDVQVRTVNATGHGFWSAIAAGTPRTMPGAPAINSLVPGDSAVTVEWSAPATDGGSGVAGYDLRFIRSDAPDKADANWTGRSGIWSSGALRYDLGGLTNGVSYEVLVRAVNSVGHGPWSPAATGTPRTTPGAPAVDSLIPGDGALTVEWSDPATDGGADVTGYDLRYIRSDAPDKADANWSVRSGIWSSGALRYDLGGLTDGVGYDVQVRAANAAGHGQWSGSITATPHTMPTAPAVVSVAAGDGALTIAWTAPADTGGLNIQSYDVRYIPAEENNPGAAWTEEQDVWTLGSLEHTITGLTNGVRYDLELRAVTSAGDGPWSSTFSGTPRTTPDVPIISLITPVGSTLTVAWDAPANTGGSAVTSYDLRYIESGAIDKADANWTVVVQAWTTGPLSYAIATLTGGTPYDVQVRAVNGAGEGPWSVTFAGTPVTIRASRSFSPEPVTAGGELEVTITAAGYGGFGQVVETLPAGFSYVRSDLTESAVTVAGQEVSFTLFGHTAFTYTVAAPSAEGTYSLSGVLKNSSGVELPVGGDSSITVEAAALSVSITRSATTLVRTRTGLPIPVTATFSKPVFGFTVDDISVGNGIASGFSGSDGGSVYTFDATPSDIGEVTVDVAAGVAEDANGNGNTAAVQLSLGITYDDDGDGAIGRNEAIAAVIDYFADRITRDEVLAIIVLYFAS